MILKLYAYYFLVALIEELIMVMPLCGRRGCIGAGYGSARQVNSVHQTCTICRVYLQFPNNAVWSYFGTHSVLISLSLSSSHPPSNAISPDVPP